MRKYQKDFRTGRIWNVKEQLYKGKWENEKIRKHVSKNKRGENVLLTYSNNRHNNCGLSKERNYQVYGRIFGRLEVQVEVAHNLG